MESPTNEEATMNRDVHSPASAASTGEACAGTGGSTNVKDEHVDVKGTPSLESRSSPVTSKSASSSPTPDSERDPEGKKHQDGVTVPEKSGRKQWSEWRENADRRPTQALWHLCDECLLSLNRENRRLHVDSSTEPDPPLMLTFTSETPVSMDATDRGNLYKRASVALSDVTVLLARNFEEFELTLLCHDLQSETEAVIKVPRWSFEELEDFFPTLRLAALKHSALAKVFASIAGESSSGGGGDVIGAANKGIQVLLRQLERMSCDPWAASSHVGCFLFRTIANHGGNAEWLSLGRIRSLMPTVFLNIPSDVDLRVGGQQVSFGYYNNCLAELTRFTAVVDSATGRWNPIDGTPNLKDNERLLHVFIGFDALRCKSDDKRSTSLVMCFLGEMGLLNNVELKQLDPLVGCGLTLLIYVPNAPASRNVSTFHFAEDAKTDYSLFKGALSAIAKSVGTGFLSHHWNESSKSMKCLVRRIQSMIGKVHDAIDGDSSVTDPLPSCYVNTFGNWKYQPETKMFADGCVVEVGLDTLHHLPPPDSFADVAESHPKSITDLQGRSHPAGQNPTRCQESHCEQEFRTGGESSQAYHAGHTPTDHGHSNRAPPTLVTPSTKLPNPSPSNEPSMRSACATSGPEIPQWHHLSPSSSPTATTGCQIGHHQRSVQDGAPRLTDSSTAWKKLEQSEIQNQKLRERLAVAEQELKLYRTGLVNANEVAEMAKTRNASLKSANQSLIEHVHKLTESNQRLKRHAQHLMEQNVALSKKARLVSPESLAIGPYNSFAPPVSWPTEGGRDQSPAFSPHNFDPAGF
jgi:hypothetical protein